MPARVLKFTDRGRAFQAFCDAATLGIEVERLAECARRMAADPEFRSRKFVPPLEDWIGKGQFRGWMADEGAAPSAAARRVFEGPAEIRASFLATFGEGPAGSWLDPCGYAAGSPATLLARTTMARDWLSRQRDWLGRHDLIVELKGRA